MDAEPSSPLRGAGDFPQGSHQKQHRERDPLVRARRRFSERSDDPVRTRFAYPSDATASWTVDLDQPGERTQRQGSRIDQLWSP